LPSVNTCLFLEQYEPVGIPDLFVWDNRQLQQQNVIICH